VTAIRNYLYKSINYKKFVLCCNAFVTIFVITVASVLLLKLILSFYLFSLNADDTVEHPVRNCEWHVVCGEERSLGFR